MNKVAKFEKVSREQFNEAMKNNPVFGFSDTAYDGIILPKRATSGSSGYDFFIPYDLVLETGQTILIPTGIRVRIDEGWLLAVFPRSGLGFRYRVRLDNTVGIIDGDYYNSDNEGHIMIKMTNEGLHGGALEIKAGQGFAQGIFLPFGITEDDAADGVRNGGFGSTTPEQ